MQPSQGYRVYRNDRSCLSIIGVTEIVPPRILPQEDNPQPGRSDDREHHAHDKRNPCRAVLELSFCRVDLRAQSQWFSS
jgi:hypothetical protein